MNWLIVGIVALVVVVGLGAASMIGAKRDRERNAGIKPRDFGD